MIKHTAIQAGIGIGLMAASLGAGAADLHTFAQPAIYYKMDGSVIKYVGFLPSGATHADSVVLLDMYQSGTISTWAYAVGGPFDSLASSTATASTAFHSHSNAIAGQAWRAAGSMYFMTPQASTSSATVSTFFGGDSRQLAMSFSVTPTISSQACNMTFNAVLDTNDYLQFPTNSITVLPSGFPTASDDVVYLTASGVSTYTVAGPATSTKTDSMEASAFNALNAIASWSLPTFGTWTIPRAAGATTVAASMLSAPFNKCVGAFNTRTATNSAGNIIGGLGGMMRLW